MFGTILSWLTGGTLDRILSSVDKSVDNATERERIRTSAVTEWVKVQATLANSRQWFFPLFFLAPAGLHFSAVTLYSILFCRGCMLPQDWTIAALPSPFSDWQGVMVTSLFIGKAGEALVARLRK